MGAAESSQQSIHQQEKSVTLDKSTILTGQDAVFQRKVETSAYGEVKIYNDKRQTSLVWAVKQKMFDNSDDFQKYMEIAQNLKALEHPYIVNMLRIYKTTQAEYCASFFRVYVAFDYFKTSLNEQIQYKSKKKSPYSEGSLFKIMFSISQALNFLQKHQIYHEDIKPQNIVIDNQEKIYKITNQKFMTGTMSQYQGFLMGINEISYLAPELFASLQRRERNPQHDIQKTEIFSLGLCILEAATFTDTQQLYDFDNFKINEKLLKDRINSLTQKHKYSEKLQEFIQLMLYIDPETRISLQQLEDKLLEYSQDPNCPPILQSISVSKDNTFITYIDKSQTSRIIPDISNTPLNQSKARNSNSKNKYNQHQQLLNSTNQNNINILDQLNQNNEKSQKKIQNYQNDDQETFKQINTEQKNPEIQYSIQKQHLQDNKLDSEPQPIKNSLTPPKQSQIIEQPQNIQINRPNPSFNVSPIPETKKSQFLGSSQYSPTNQSNLKQTFLQQTIDPKQSQLPQTKPFIGNPSQKYKAHAFQTPDKQQEQNQNPNNSNTNNVSQKISFLKKEVEQQKQDVQKSLQTQKPDFIQQSKPLSKPNNSTIFNSQQQNQQNQEEYPGQRIVQKNFDQLKNHLESLEDRIENMNQKYKQQKPSNNLFNSSYNNNNNSLNNGTLANNSNIYQQEKLKESQRGRSSSGIIDQNIQNQQLSQQYNNNSRNNLMNNSLYSHSNSNMRNSSASHSGANRNQNINRHSQNNFNNVLSDQIYTGYIIPQPKFSHSKK